MQPERRKAPRTEVLGRLAVEVMTCPMPAVVREMSVGGFSLETTAPPPHGVHRFRFQMPDETPVEISAESVHSARISLSTGGTVYVSGFEFLPAGAGTQQAITALNDHIAALCLAS